MKTSGPGAACLSPVFIQYATWIIVFTLFVCPIIYLKSSLSQDERGNNNNTHDGFLAQAIKFGCSNYYDLQKMYELLATRTLVWETTRLFCITYKQTIWGGGTDLSKIWRIMRKTSAMGSATHKSRALAYTRPSRSSKSDQPRPTGNQSRSCQNHSLSPDNILQHNTKN